MTYLEYKKEKERKKKKKEKSERAGGRRTEKGKGKRRLEVLEKGNSTTLLVSLVTLIADNKRTILHNKTIHLADCFICFFLLLKVNKAKSTARTTVINHDIRASDVTKAVEKGPKSVVVSLGRKVIDKQAETTVLNRSRRARSSSSSGSASAATETGSRLMLHATAIVSVVSLLMLTSKLDSKRAEAKLGEVHAAEAVDGILGMVNVLELDETTAL